MFDINSKIVCINDSFPLQVLATYDEIPKQGNVFTVRDIIPATDYGRAETCAVLLHQVRNTPNENGVENGFACHRFRELT